MTPRMGWPPGSAGWTRSGPSMWSASSGPTRVNDWHVTALPPEGGSFSSRRRGLIRAQPGPGVDVPGPVDVGVDRARSGADHGVLPRSGAPRPAGVAVDARAGRVHQDHSPASFFRFAGEDARELGPACVEDRLVQPGLGRCAVWQVRARLIGVGLRRGPCGSSRPRSALPARSRRMNRPGPARSCGGSPGAGYGSSATPWPGSGAAAVVARPGLARALRRCRSVITAADAARNRGLATISPSRWSGTAPRPRLRRPPGRGRAAARARSRR